MPRNACTRPNRRGVRKTLVAGLVLTTPPVVGTTLIVLDGPGLGQTRLITAVGPGNNTVVLESALDDWVVATSTISRESGGGTGQLSLVAIVSSFVSVGSVKSIVTTLESVVAATVTPVLLARVPRSLLGTHLIGLRWSNGAFCRVLHALPPHLSIFSRSTGDCSFRTGMETQCAGLWQITGSMTATSSQVCVAK